MIYLCIYKCMIMYIYNIYIYLSTYSCLSNLYFYSYELSLTDEWFSSEHVVANKHTQVFCLSFSSFNVFKQYLSKTCVYRKSIYLCIMKQSSHAFPAFIRKWPLWKVMKFSSKETKATLWSLITSMIATWGFFFQMRFIWSQLKISWKLLSSVTVISTIQTNYIIFPKSRFCKPTAVVQRWFLLLVDRRHRGGGQGLGWEKNRRWRTVMSFFRSSKNTSDKWPRNYLKILWK